MEAAKGITVRWRRGVCREGNASGIALPYAILRAV